MITCVCVGKNRSKVLKRRFLYGMHFKMKMLKAIYYFNTTSD